MKVPAWAKEAAKHDAVIAFLIETRQPITRRAYVGLNWMGDRDPEKYLGAECESMLPEPLQWKRRRSR